MEQLEALLETLCPPCAAAVRATLDQVKAAAAAEGQKKHEANEAAAQSRTNQPGEAEAVLKGKR